MNFDQVLGAGIVVFALTVVLSITAYNIKADAIQLEETKVIAEMIKGGANPLLISCALTDRNGDNPVCIAAVVK